MTSRSDRLVRWVAAMWQLEHVMFFLILVVIDIARAKWRRTPAFNLTLPYGMNVKFVWRVSLVLATVKPVLFLTIDKL